MGDSLLPLTEQAVYVCLDMQRIFSADGPWPTPWMGVFCQWSPLWPRAIPAEPSSHVSSPQSGPSSCPACGSAITYAGTLPPANSWIHACWN
jgi:hypothetical protein